MFTSNFTLVCTGAMAFIFFLIYVSTFLNAINNLNEMKFIRKLTFYNNFIIKQLFYRSKISIYLILEFLKQLNLLALMILLIPIGDQIIGNNIISLSNNEQTNLIKLILITTLLPSIEIIKNINIKNIYHDFIIRLDKIMITIFNLFVISDISVNDTFLIKRYPGILFSFFLLVLVSEKNKKRDSLDTLVRTINRRIKEIVWILFVLFYFINISNIYYSTRMFLLISTVLVILFILLLSIIKKTQLSNINLSSYSNTLRVSLLLSVFNFIVLELYELY